MELRAVFTHWRAKQVNYLCESKSLKKGVFGALNLRKLCFERSEDRNRQGRA